jgi:hypothetical protein
MAALGTVGGSPAALAAEDPRQPVVSTHTIRTPGSGEETVPRRYRQSVAQSVDPDGFILKPELRNDLGTLAPPSCIEARDDHPAVGLATVTVTNDCPVGQRIKVLIAFWFDSACLVVPPRSSVAFQYANSARFDGLVTC